MSTDLHSTLHAAAGASPVPPDPAALQARGRRRRRAVRTATSTAVAVVLVAGVAGLAGLRATPQEVQVADAPEEGAPGEPATSAVDAPGIVVRTGGATPSLPRGAAEIDVSPVLLAGLPAGPLDAVAVADDGRVAHVTGSVVRVAAAGDTTATVRRVPGRLDRCASPAFDADGVLWAVCRRAGGTGAVLLRDDGSALDTLDVTAVLEQVVGALPDTRTTPVVLAVDGTDVTAVVQVRDPSEQGASTVQLVRDGEPLAPATAAGSASTLPEVSPEAGTAGLGRQVRLGVVGGPTTVEVTWLDHRARATVGWTSGLTGPGTRVDVGDAYLGDTVAITLAVAGGEGPGLFGVAARADGTTAVLRLPASGDGPTSDPAAAPGPATSVLRVAPGGSVHLVTVEGGVLAVAEVLDAGLRPDGA